MAEYRTVHTKMWREDEWFQELDTDAKLLWIYLFTNPSASVAGIYRLPIRTMASECGLGKDRVAKLLGNFQAAGKIDYQDGVLWVHKMREYQLPGIVSPKVLTRINKDLAEIPDGIVKVKYMTHYGYPIDTVSVLPLNSNINGDSNGNGDRDEPAAPEPSAAKPPTPELPASVQVYLANGGTFPTGKLQDDTTKKDRAIQFISEHVKSDPDSLALWGRVVAGYCAQWSNKSYTVMVNDYYLTGRIPGAPKPQAPTNGNGRGYSNAPQLGPIKRPGYEDNRGIPADRTPRKRPDTTPTG